MIQFEISTLIDRPVQEIYTFLSNPLNLPRWQTMILDVQQISKGPMGPGATFSTRGEMLGRRIEGIGEIVEFEPPLKFGYQASAGPITVRVGFALKPVGSGAKVTLSARGEPGGMFKLAEGMLARQVKSQMEENLVRLKRLLESGVS